MQLLNIIVVGLLSAFLIWQLVSYIRSNPDALAPANINKSVYTLGLLALALIVFLGLVIFLLKH